MQRLALCYQVVVFSVLASAHVLPPWPPALFVPKSTPTPPAASGGAPTAKPRYGFDYSVNNPGTGDIKSQWETRDGDVVRGSYTVVQPDGSVLTVEYTADGVNGYKAVVKKDGAAVKPLEPPKGLEQVPLYLALKPILGVLPTAATPTTTPAPPTTTSSTTPNWPPSNFDDIYEKFWKTYGTSLYGYDRDFFNKNFHNYPIDDPNFNSFYKGNYPSIPFYYHFGPEEPKKETPTYPIYYYLPSKTENSNKPDLPYPYNFYFGFPDNFPKINPFGII